MRGSSSNYFFAYYLDQPSVMALLERFGLTGAAGEASGSDRAVAAQASATERALMASA